jgi:hypothetical protein
VVQNAISRRGIYPVQLRLHRLVTGGANDGDLPRAQSIPNPDLMSGDGRAAPRQQQLGPLHPAGTACGEEDNTQASREAVRIAFHIGSVPGKLPGLQPFRPNQF